MKGSILVPNVTQIPKQSSLEKPAQAGTQKTSREFDDAFSKALKQGELSQIKAPLKISAHANQRLSQRNIALGQELVGKLNQAVDQAAAKGVDDTLVLTDDVAFIVNVKNRTVVTAMDKGSLTGNVFTNIDGAVIV